MKVLGASLDLTNKKVVNLADPTADTDGVNKQYLDSVIRGLDWKPEVLAASTADVTLATPGTTLDGVTLTNPCRVLLKNQAAPAENGIYVWTASGSPLTRALDADTAVELTGSTVTVQQGSVNADRMYRVTSDDTLALGTDPVVWVQIGAGATPYTAGDGLVLTGQDFDIVPAAGGGIAVAADSISVDTAVVVRKFASTVSSGATSPVTVAHGLATADLTVALMISSTGEVVYPDVAVDATNVVLTFGTSPTVVDYRLVVHG